MMTDHRLASIVIDSGRHEIRRNGRTVRLTPSEFMVFQTIWLRHGKVCRTEHILHQLYGARLNCDRPEGIVAPVVISKIRGKIAVLGILIVNVFGVGYRLDLPHVPKRMRMAA